MDTWLLQIINRKWCVAYWIICHRQWPWWSSKIISGTVKWNGLSSVSQKYSTYKVRNELQQCQSHMSNYFYCCIRPERLSYDAEPDLLAIALFLVILMKLQPWWQWSSNKTTTNHNRYGYVTGNCLKYFWNIAWPILYKFIMFYCKPKTQSTLATGDTSWIFMCVVWLRHVDKRW